jgi:hypothetical protein
MNERSTHSHTSRRLDTQIDNSEYLIRTPRKSSNLGRLYLVAAVPLGITYIGRLFRD